MLPFGMSTRNTASKFSISIPADLASFVDGYQQEHGLSRSEVISKGLEKLRDTVLADAYRREAEDRLIDDDREFWDRAAIDDGLGDEDSRW